MTQHFEQGSSLLEAVIVLLLGTSIICGIFSTVIQNTRFIHHERSELGDQQTAAFLQSEVERIVADSDSHQGVFPLRVHSPGKLHFFDGSGFSTRISPERTSTAITSVRLRPLESLSIEKIQLLNADHLTVTGCAISPEKISFAKDDSILASSIDSQMELIIRAHSRSGSCWNLELQVPDHSMISNTREDTLQFAHLLIPIESISTLFLSANKEARLLHFRGDQIIENQPLPFSLSKLNCDLSSSSKSSPSTLRCKALSINDAHFNVTTHSILKPLQVETLLLNLRVGAI